MFAFNVNNGCPIFGWIACLKGFNIIAKKCVSEDTQILVMDKSSGHFVRKTLSELWEICSSFNVLSWNALKGQSEVQKAIMIDAGIKPVIRLTTASGRVIEASSGHKLFVLRDGKLLRKEIQHIDMGDELACLKK